MKGREGRDAFMSELLLNGVTETFQISDKHDISVNLPEIGWKEKSVEILEFNRPIVT